MQWYAFGTSWHEGTLKDEVITEPGSLMHRRRQKMRKTRMVGVSYVVWDVLGNDIAPKPLLPRRALIQRHSQKNSSTTTTPGLRRIPSRLRLFHLLILCKHTLLLMLIISHQSAVFLASACDTMTIVAKHQYVVPLTMNPTIHDSSASTANHLQ